MRALALRRVAVGRLSTAPALLTAKILAAAGHDPGPGRGRLRIDGVGVFSIRGPRGKTHFGMECDLLVRCPPPLSDASESPSPGLACPGPPSRANTAHGTAHPSSRTRWGERRRWVPPAVPTRARCLFTLLGPAIVDPYPSRFVTLLSGSGTGRGPGPCQSHVPCQRADVAGPRLPAFHCRHARARARFGAFAGCSESIRILGLLRRPPTRS